MYIAFSMGKTNMEKIVVEVEVNWMEAGVRNKLVGKITEIKGDNMMSLIKMTVDGWNTSPLVSSVMTKESLQDANFKEGDTVEALIKAVNVVFVKH